MSYALNGLDFAFSPRVPSPRPFLLQKFVIIKCCHLAGKKATGKYALRSSTFLPPPVANWQDLPIKGDQKEVLLLCEGNFAQIHM